MSDHISDKIKQLEATIHQQAVELAKLQNFKCPMCNYFVPGAKNHDRPNK